MRLTSIFLFPSLLLASGTHQAVAKTLLRAASAINDNNASSSVSTAIENNNRELQTTAGDDEECIVVVRAGTKLFDDHRQGSGIPASASSSSSVEEEFFCESSDGTLAAIEGTETQTKELSRKLEEGTLISSQTALDMPFSRGRGSDGRPYVSLPGNQKVQFKRGSGRGGGGGGGGRRSGGRRLIDVVGVKTVLVIRVTDGSGRVPPDSAATISNNVFGTSGDTNNMVTQFAACSYGAMTITNDYVTQGVMTQAQFNAVNWAAPGVIQVTTTASLENVGSVETEAVTRAATALGIPVPGPQSATFNAFDFVMINVQDCFQSSGCGYAAYAYLNHWRSLYLREYVGFPAVILHEIGHNMNLAHSGETVTYDDHTCLMGNPLWGYDLGRMCFNPAKNWQLTHSPNTPGEWYPSHTRLVNLLNEPSNTATVTLVGVAERDVNGNQYPITVKLETGTPTDYFLGFNRNIGMNDQNVEADDHVTMVRAGADGENYATSTLVAKLLQGGSTTVYNFVQGRDLILSVQSIDTTSSPGVAVVQASLAAERVCMTGVSVNVEVVIVTDNYPTETAWAVTAADGTTLQSVPAGGYTVVGATYATPFTVTQNGCLTFQITDSWGDGICCGYGSGSYTLRMNGNQVATGGAFSTSDTVIFGMEATGPEPTNPPTTPSPTNSPSKKPTSAPTDSPSKKPTNSPTDSPSKKPTNSPTGSPNTTPTTNSPTSSPTTVSPTKGPTNTPTYSPTTRSPTRSPSKTPTYAPTNPPTNTPTYSPTTRSPTRSPSKTPTDAPTNPPTNKPTVSPTTRSPTGSPSTAAPTKAPTFKPTNNPTPNPTPNPTNAFDCSTITNPRRESNCPEGCTYVRISWQNRCCVNDGQPQTCN